MVQSATPNPGQNDDKGNGPKNPRASEFDIPKFVVEKYPDLIDLIIDTKSMDDKERQYWFHILPIMSDAQVNKLVNILTTEKKKLAEIDRQYSSKLNDIQKKRISFWEEQSYKDRMKKLRTNEKSAEQVEAEKEAELLKELEGM